MQATFELKKAPNRVVIAGFGMLAALVIGGAGGYAVKGLTAGPAILSTGVTSVSTSGIASQASDPGSAKRALRIELQDEKSQASVAAPAAATRTRRTQQ
jgi:hypothetical protein